MPQAAGSDLRITDVRPIPIGGRTLFVLVRASNGAVGLGECWPIGIPVIAAMIQHNLRPRLMNKDPFNVEALYEEMLYGGNFTLGPMGIVSEAIAGIDIALWDLKGKILNQPVYKLLGGRYRDRQPAYFSYGWNRKDTPADVARLMASAVERGFTGVKIRMHLGAAVLDRPDDPTESYIAAIRKAVGDSVAVGLDANNGYTAKRAIVVGRRLHERYNIAFFEEPTPQYDYPAMATVAASLQVPIAAGESEFTLWQFKDLITQSGITLVQPDLTKCGGITQARKVAAVALACNKHIVAHNMVPTVGTAATIHFAASCSNAAQRQEFDSVPRPDLDRFFENKLDLDRGHFRVPDLPGLGLIPRESEMLEV